MKAPEEVTTTLTLTRREWEEFADFLDQNNSGMISKDEYEYISDLIDYENMTEALTNIQNAVTINSVRLEGIT
jgi:hypothetical protein